MCSECLSSPFCPLRQDSPCARRYGLSLRNTFVLSGLSSIATGLMFDIPMAVQPMKSIAAVALTAEAGEFSIESMLAAGIITASFVMLLGVTGLIDAFNRNLPWDQFTIESLAGDLLPNATLEQRLGVSIH